jgi:hypothetical protein
MPQPLTEEWMQQLGRDDGADVAKWVVDELAATEAASNTNRVAEAAVGRVHELVSQYEQRGVSADLIALWRSACMAEIHRRFALLRENTDGAQPDSTATDRQDEASPPVAAGDGS